MLFRSIEASPVTVSVAKEGEPPDTARVPEVAGRVSVTVAASVAWRVAEPEVAPLICTGIFFP